MENRAAHLSHDLIKTFAYDEAVLQPHEFQHLKNCDECSYTWWKLKREAKDKKKDLRGKSA